MQVWVLATDVVITSAGVGSSMMAMAAAYAQVGRMKQDSIMPHIHSLRNSTSQSMHEKRGHNQLHGVPTRTHTVA
jgi:hypothetical protein